MVVNLQQMRFTPQGAEQTLIGPIDLQISTGEWLCVLGGNGSGKSTFAQLLSGWCPNLLQGHIQGTAQVLDHSLDALALVQVAASRQLIQQSPQLQLSGCAFTVWQEIAFGPENLGLPADEIVKRVNDAIEMTFCDPLRNRHPATLSGGEAQRVVLASALAMRPQLLLLDEAFSRLTPAATHRLLSQLKQYSEQTGCCVILFERSLLPAISFCDDFLLLSSGAAFSEAGKVLAAGSLEEVFTAAADVINMPDAWRAVAHLNKLKRWNLPIPRTEEQLLKAFKDDYAAI